MILRTIMVSILLFAVSAVGFEPRKNETIAKNKLLPWHDLHSLMVKSNFQREKGLLSPENFHAVEQYAREYGVDPLLILSVIQQESQYDPDAVSNRGAVGLMQIMPVTNAEILDVLSAEDLQLPKKNIRAGVFYFSQLLDLFKDSEPDDRMRLALAAYNAGPSRIYDAQELGAYLGENPHYWTTIQHMLPLLSKRYYSLHEIIWEGGKPRSGYFGDWKQTTTYVEGTMEIYHRFIKESE
ncbi:MAG TPA: transglycosylase SLT domain-containing protein [Bacteroidota bacterium]|nr:transglycosylase SLT domain-containing protein [Bacteroidota bacterium]